MDWKELGKALAEMPAQVVEAFFNGISDVEQSVGTKGLIAIILTSTGAACVIYEIPLPEWFVGAMVMIVTLYFGGSLALMKAK